MGLGASARGKLAAIVQVMTAKIALCYGARMTKLEIIRTEITELPEAEVMQLRAWLDEYAEQRWDAQIERDAAAGKLDHLIAEAKADAATSAAARRMTARELDLIAQSKDDFAAGRTVGLDECMSNVEAELSLLRTTRI